MFASEEVLFSLETFKEEAKVPSRDQPQAGDVVGKGLGGEESDNHHPLSLE